MHFATHHLYFLIALGILSCGYDTTLAETTNTSRSVSEVVNLIHFGKNDREAESLLKPYARLFGEASAMKLSALRKHPNVGIALRAAWEEIVRNMPNRSDLSEEQRTDGVLIERISPQALWFFVGFSEGRLRAQLPEWWKPWFLNARTYGAEYLKRMECRNVIFSSDLEKAARTDVSGLRETPLGFLVSPEIKNVQKQGDGSFLLTLATDRRWSVPPLVLPDALNEDRDLTVPAISVAAVDDKRLVIAVYDMAADGRSLVWCISRATPCIAWRSIAWGSVSYGGASGPPLRHLVEVRCQDETVYVFGVGQLNIYVEAFSLNDGANRFRFSTSY